MVVRSSPQNINVIPVKVTLRVNKSMWTEQKKLMGMGVSLAHV